MTENKNNELQKVVDSIQKIIERRYNKLQVNEALDIIDLILEETQDIFLFEAIKTYISENKGKMNIFECKTYLQGIYESLTRYKKFERRISL